MDNQRNSAPTRIGAMIERAVKEQRTSYKAVSVAAGLGDTYVRDLVKGRSLSPNFEKLQKIAKVLDLNFVDLTKSDDGFEVPVRAFVGAGSEVHMFPDHDHEPLEMVRRPYGGDLPEKLCAAVVRGDSMEPMMLDGWLLFIESGVEHVQPDAINALSIVKVKGNGLLVKVVRPAARPGLFHLESINRDHKTLYDQELIWATPVLDIRPRRAKK